MKCQLRITRMKHEWSRIRRGWADSRSYSSLRILLAWPRPDVDAEVEAALAVYDDIEVVTKDAAARAEIPRVLEALNLRLWLNFGEGKKGKRAIRVLKRRLDHDGRGGIADAPVRPRRRPRRCGVGRKWRVATRRRRNENAVRQTQRFPGRRFVNKGASGRQDTNRTFHRCRGAVTRVRDRRRRALHVS